MHPIILITLDTHIIGAQMLHPTPIDLDRSFRLEDPDGLVSLTHVPLVGLVETGRIRGEEEARPEAGFLLALVAAELGFAAFFVGRAKPGCLGDCGVQDCVEPVDGCLEVEIVPKTVAVDEGVGAGRFGSGELFTKAGELLGWDGEADHFLDWERLD